jgi:hypothetical protein
VEEHAASSISVITHDNEYQRLIWFVIYFFIFYYTLSLFLGSPWFILCMSLYGVYFQPVHFKVGPLILNLNEAEKYESLWFC